MKNIFITLLIVVLSIFRCISQQDINIDKSVFKIKDEGFKEAWQNVKEADNYYKEGSTYFKQALNLYLEACKYNSYNAALNYKTGICYLYSFNKTKAIPYLEKAYSTDKNVSIDILLFLGRSYHFNYEFDKALETYSEFIKSLSSKEINKYRKKTEKLMAECKYGKKLYENPVRVFIENLDTNINSTASDYSPLISADESMMIFTSRRDNTTGNTKNDDGSYCEDIYVAYKENGEWQKAQNIGKPLNTKNNDATVGLSPDGQQLFLFNGARNNGDILMCKLEGETWTKPESLPRTINTDFKEASASFSPDGNTMYFVSNRDDVNFGGMDIYVSTKNRKGKWDAPVNLGETVNSEYNEMGVFMHPDSKTLYFSSKGHNTIGGFDVFKTVYNDSTKKWSEPENLGYPVNTTYDDLFFVMTANGRRAYYTSSQKGGTGERDIYCITFLHDEKCLTSNEDNLLAGLSETISEKEKESEKDDFQSKMKLTLLSGVVRDKETLEPVFAEIEIVDNDKNMVISTFSSNSKSGNYLVSLPSGKNYGIAVKAKGYLFYSENINTKNNASYQDIRQDIFLQKITKGAKIVLNNIFFAAGKSNLNPESLNELERLVDILKENPKIKVEISGHTDNIGSRESNQKLSEQRAKEVVDSLKKQGIDKDRLRYKGYAFSKPVASNDTKEGRKQNRRVEFEIIE